MFRRFRRSFMGNRGWVATSLVATLIIATAGPIQASVEADENPWTELPDGSLYRALSEHEVPDRMLSSDQAYAYDPAFVDRLASAADTVKVFVPTFAGIQEILLHLESSRSSVPVQVSSVGVGGTEVPGTSEMKSIRHYRTATDDAHTVQATAVQDGGFYMQGHVAGTDVVAATWNPAWPLTGSARGGDLLVVSTSDDPGGGVQVTICCTEEDPGEPYAYAMMGETKWCTHNAGSWDAEIATMATEVDTAFGDTAVDMQVELLHCWITVDADGEPHPDASEWCDQGFNDEGVGVICEEADGTIYVYGRDTFDFNNAADRRCAVYQNRVFDDVNEADADDPAQNFNPDVAQTLHFEDRDGYDGQCEAPDGGLLCGRGDNEGPTSVARAKAGLSDADQIVARCKSYVPSHEFGHNFGTDHGKAVAVPTGCPVGQDCHTVMRQSGNTDIRRNEFSDLNEQEIETCVDNGCV